MQELINNGSLNFGSYKNIPPEITKKLKFWTANISDGREFLEFK